MPHTFAPLSHLHFTILFVQEVEVLTIIPNKKELGKLFKKDAKVISDALEALSECEQG